jgi:hypothetical protein
MTGSFDDCMVAAARRKEAELGEELQFHLEQEARERREAGLREDEATLGGASAISATKRVREERRALWTWRPLDELSQDLRFAFRTMFKHRAVRCSRSVAGARHRRQHGDLQLHGRDPAAIAAGRRSELARGHVVAAASVTPEAKPASPRRS